MGSWNLQSRFAFHHAPIRGLKEYIGMNIRCQNECDPIAPKSHLK